MRPRVHRHQNIDITPARRRDRTAHIDPADEYGIRLIRQRSSLLPFRGFASLAGSVMYISPEKITPHGRLDHPSRRNRSPFTEK